MKETEKEVPNCVTYQGERRRREIILLFLLPYPFGLYGVEDVNLSLEREGELIWPRRLRLQGRATLDRGRHLGLCRRRRRTDAVDLGDEVSPPHERVGVHASVHHDQRRRADWERERG